ncbi:MAG: tetratricopeptide repeat protein [Fimbriimonadaceae bacterium]|nr:MAG: tetratricopeptide repeat protein [Fimbriimonadaceae bacterium]
MRFDYRKAYESGQYQAVEEALWGLSEDADALHVLGLSRFARGQFPEAVEALSRAFSADPTNLEVRTNLAIALRRAGSGEAARELLLEVEAASPRDARYWNALAALYLDGSAWLPAREALEQAVSVQPDHPEANANLAIAALALGDWSSASQGARAATALAPESATAWTVLGRVHFAAGEVEEGLRCLELAHQLDPDSGEAASYLLLRAAASPDWSPERLRALAEKVRPAERPRPPSARRGGLKVGFVSGDLLRHPVGLFLLPVLRHAAAGVEVVSYANQARSDEVTDELRTYAHQWRDIWRRGPQEVSALIEADGIDVLVDLSGHSSGNRLDVFALRPAPLQVAWLGYSGTTGLSAMDFVLLDPTVAAGDVRGHYTESILKLPHSLFCMPKPGDAPPPNPGGEGPPRFGVFNNPAKFSQGCGQAWGEVLRRVEHSRLLIKGPHFHDPGLARRFKARLRRLGVDPSRVDLEGYTDRADHWRSIQSVDVALDTFPYGGATTTTDCLWAGVPVVTLIGDRYTSRMGASIVRAAGHPEWVAEDDADYVNKAGDLVADRRKLAATRLALPEEVASSPLADEAGFAAAFWGLVQELAGRDQAA